MPAPNADGTDERSMPTQVGHLSREVWPRLPGTLSHAPMVLLVNRSTASASEVLAGALHDNGRCARHDSHERALGFNVGKMAKVARRLRRQNCVQCGADLEPGSACPASPLLVTAYLAHKSPAHSKTAFHTRAQPPPCCTWDSERAQLRCAIELGCLATLGSDVTHPSLKDGKICARRCVRGES